LNLYPNAPPPREALLTRDRKSRGIVDKTTIRQPHLRARN
jgi:hypothetical protein